MKYHAHVSPRSLTTIAGDPLRNYPAYWELMKWYLCWRKVPYESEIVAALLAEDRQGEYSHYPCPLDPSHWHIGRGDGTKTARQRHPQAKRVYRKAVRDEIWRDHEAKVARLVERDSVRGGTGG
jgi:hypothetical protein